jgi:alanine racemase
VRHSYVDVDLEAIGHNIATFRRLVAPAGVCAVVKADGYGHGDVPVAEAAIDAGATCLAVALVAEGARLREAGIEAQILLLSEPPPEAAPEVIRWGLTPTVYTPGFADALSRLGAGDVHLKVDTGMHRVGADATDVLALVRRLSQGGLDLAGMWTHFSAADEDPGFTAHQLERFLETVEAVRAAGFEVPMLHAANTAAAIMLPASRLDMVRIGIGTYGLRPAPGIGDDLGLRPAMRVVSEVRFMRRLPAGARPSYGRRIPLAGDSVVATIPIGYADGMPRRLSSVGGEVLIRGRRFPLAGTVTMDHIVVAVDDDVEVGDEVVLIGRQGDAQISADEWAGMLDTINYEVVCQIGPRMPRRYEP